MAHVSAPATESKALLSKVIVTDAVVQSCLAHAFTSEKEEIMGVLLGNVSLVDDEPPAGVADGAGQTKSKVATIWSAHIMPRNVHSPDRVEVAVEALISASSVAEELTERTGVPTRVVGWYHSHPQITSVPSTVDLMSQRNYQQLESGWVGLIFSVFHTNGSNRNDCAIHCFQTGEGNRHVKVPLHVVTHAHPALGHDAGPLTHAMLRMFGEELDSAVNGVRERTDNDAAAMRAARSLRVTQLYTLERLLGEPTVKHLEWCTIPYLKGEADRLEAELERLS